MVFKQSDVGARQMSNPSIRINLKPVARSEMLDNLHVKNGGRPQKRSFRHSILEHVLEYDPASLENISVPIYRVVDLEGEGVPIRVLHHSENFRVMEMNVRNVHPVSISANVEGLLHLPLGEASTVG